MSEFGIINEIKKNSKPNLFVKKVFDILDIIHEIMKEKDITQKEIAERLGKSESEVSKWLNGVQNFTLKTLTKLEEALGEDIIVIPQRKQKSISSYAKREHIQYRATSIIDNDFVDFSNRDRYSGVKSANVIPAITNFTVNCIKTNRSKESIGNDVDEAYIVRKYRKGLSGKDDYHKIDLSTLGS